jgi:ATP-dependent Clp protease protease subunit
MRFLLVLMAFLATILTANVFAKEQKKIILTKDNTIVLNEAFTGSSASALIGKAKEMDSTLPADYPIYLFLNTPGGSIQAGLEIIEFLKGLNRPVHTVTIFAASMGWQLLQHLGTRYVLEYGVLMSHKARGGFEGEFGGGHSQIDSRYSLWLRRTKDMDEQTVRRTNGKKTLEKYWSEYDNELWLTGAEAVKNGYADEVVIAKCDPSLTGTTSHNISFMGFLIDFELDNCPLRTYPVSIKVNVRSNMGTMDLDQFLSKGGVFGKCEQEEEQSAYSWSTRQNVIQKPKLCALDKTLTYEKILKAKEEKTNEFLNKRNHVKKMSYGSFVSEF